MQQWIVYLIVAYAACVVGKRYAPVSLRRGTSAWLHAKFTHLGWSVMADKFVPGMSATASCGDGCSSCNSCESNDTAATIKQFAVTPDALRQTIRR